MKAKISQEQFTQMVAKKTEHQAVESAITAGDYTAFKNAMIAQIPTEPEFQKMVTMRKTRIEAQAKIEAAVKNNDFAAFRTAIEAQKVQMVAEHPGMEDVVPKALWDEKLQKHFDTLVEYYKTNGKLPEIGKGFWPMGGGMMGPKWMGHGSRGEGRRGE